jgi:hypothetical protein
VSTAAAVAAGRTVFNQHCSHCHSPNAHSPEPARDLRRLRIRYGERMTAVFYETVSEGRAAKGMPPWKEILSRAARARWHGRCQNDARRKCDPHPSTQECGVRPPVGPGLEDAASVAADRQHARSISDAVAGGGWQAMADQFKCTKCGKTSPKFTNCCGAPMKKA